MGCCRYRRPAGTNRRTFRVGIRALSSESLVIRVNPGVCEVSQALQESMLDVVRVARCPSQAGRGCAASATRARNAQESAFLTALSHAMRMVSVILLRECVCERERWRGEGGREGRRKGGMGLIEGRDGGSEVGKEGRSEGRREGRREGGREGGRARREVGR